MKNSISLLLLVLFATTAFTQIKEDYYDWGFESYKNGNYQTSVDQYTKAINLDKAYYDCYYNRGLAYYCKSSKKVNL